MAAMPPGARPTSIALIVNGDHIAVVPPIILRGSTIFVPLRKILDIFGLPFDLHGKRISTQVGSSVVNVSIGSDLAAVDDQTVRLNSPVQEINGFAYVPLRFLTDVLKAQAIYNSKLRAVTINADHIGISSSGIVNQGGRSVATGTVSAVDLLTDPPTMTLLNNGRARTYEIGRNATITAQDVVINVRAPGELGAIHPGDFARIALGRNGQAQYVTDSFGSRSGVIIAVGSGFVLLNDGDMVHPDRTTTVSLNGTAVGIDALQAQDRAVVRYNVESGEIRQILASRTLAHIPAAAAAIRIDSVQDDARRPLRAGDRMSVTLSGTPNALAWFDIGPFVSGVPLTQTSSGTYVGSYTILAGSNFEDVPVIGRLTIGGVAAAPVQAPNHLSAATSPPAISSFGPRDGVSINSARPAIFATFATSAVPVDPSSVMLRVNGHDVTASCIRTARFISYLPGVNWPAGPMSVEVRATDLAGNATDFTWHFTLHP